MSGKKLNDGLPKGWSYASLDIICNVIMGQSPPSSTYNNTKIGLPFFQGKAEFTDLYPHAIKWCSAPNKIAEKDDVLISVRAPVGPTNLAPSKCCIGRGLAALSPHQGVHSRFILYFMRLRENVLADQGTGTTFSAISGNILRSFNVPIASTNEQHRIVAKLEELFSDLDAGVAALQRAKTNLKRYRASVLKAAVEGKLTEKWRAENKKNNKNNSIEPASKLLERILVERRQKWEADQLEKWRKKKKDSGWSESKIKSAEADERKKISKRYCEPAEHEQENLPGIPSSWQWISLGYLTWSVKDGPHYSPHYTEDGIPFISSRNIRQNGIDFSTAKYITPQLHMELSERCSPAYGDLLYTKGGTTGIALVNREHCDFNVWVHLAVLKLVDSIDPEFVQYALNSPFCYMQSQNYTHGVGNQDLGLTRMVKIALTLPPLQEQVEIVSIVEERLSIIVHIENDIDRQLKLTSNLRQSTLKRAFEGKLVPQDPSDEPASILLERIAKLRAQDAKNIKNKVKKVTI